MVVSLAPPPQLWLPPEISFLRIASNANLSGTSGRALFPAGRFCQNIFSASLTFASNVNFSREVQRSPCYYGQVLIVPAFLALQTQYYYIRDNVYRDCQVLCDLGFKCHLLICPVSHVNGVLHFEVIPVLFINRALIFRQVPVKSLHLDNLADLKNDICRNPHNQ